MFGIANTLFGKVSLTIAILIAGALGFYEGVHETPEVPAVTVAPEDNVGAPSSGTIDRLDQWTSTTTPTLAITQRTWGKDIKLTGYESLTCLGTDANGYLGAGTCGGGGAGSGTVSTSTPLTNTQVTYATGVSTIGSDAGFTYNSTDDRFTIVNASSTNWSSSYASSTNLFAGTFTIGGDAITEFVGNGLTLSGSTLQATLGTTIAANEMASADFGSFTCNGTSCTVDAGAISNTMLANSTISGIALGSNLGDLTAGNSSLTFSGTYNGSTARNIVLNVGNANTWTALQTFSNSTTSLASFAYASSTVWRGGGLTADCDTAATSKLLWDATTGQFSCGTDQNSGGGGGSGNVSTSSAETATQVPFWTSTAATPALLSGGSSSFVWDNTLLKLTVANASTTRFSALTEAKFGSTATSTFNSAGVLSLASALAVSSGGTGLTTFGGTDRILFTTSADNIASNADFTFNTSAATLTLPNNSEIIPAVNGGGTLGTASAGWSALHLSTGGSINWANGLVTLTHDSASDSINVGSGKFGVASTTPYGLLSVSGIAGTTYPIFSVASSSHAAYLNVGSNGTTTIAGPSAASSTPYIFSTAAGKGGGFIVEDVDGAGCTEVTTLNGVVSAQIVTCPAEN